MRGPANLILICGSRFWNQPEIIMDAMLARSRETTLFMHGLCPSGADDFCDRICRRFEYDCLRVPARWKYGEVKGPPEGPMRNERMADLYVPTEVWAFHENIQSSKGTKHMLSYAMSCGLEPRLHNGRRWMDLWELDL